MNQDRMVSVKQDILTRLEPVQDQDD
jgi:hypothetical protein